MTKRKSDRAALDNKAIIEARRIRRERMLQFERAEALKQGTPISRVGSNSNLRIGINGRLVAARR